MKAGAKKHPNIMCYCTHLFAFFFSTGFVALHFCTACLWGYKGAYPAMGGGGLCRVMGSPRNGSCSRMSGTCVTCVTCAGCATMTWRGGVIGKCAVTRVVTWVSSKGYAWNGYPSLCEAG